LEHFTETGSIQSVNSCAYYIGFFFSPFSSQEEDFMFYAQLLRIKTRIVYKSLLDYTPEDFWLF
jgi:hypothetical protein